MMNQCKSRLFRRIMFAYSIFELLFCSGPIFGWASLAYILKKENYFAESCNKYGQHNTTRIHTETVCSEQDNSLNVAYTVGFLTVGLVSFPVGYLLDTCGPKIARYASSALFGISSAFWINFTRDSQHLIYPAVLTLSSAGIFSSFAFFQVSAFLCHNHQSTVLGLQNGAFNASAVILNIIKILYEVQKLFRLEILLSLYCGLSSILVLGATFIFVPSKDELAKHAANRHLAKDALLEERAEKGVETFEQPNKAGLNGNCEISAYGGSEKLIVSDNWQDGKDNATIAIRIVDDTQNTKRGSIPNGLLNASASNLDMMNDVDNMKLTAFNVILKGSKLSIDSCYIDAAMQDHPKTGVDQSQKQTLRDMLSSGIYLWHVFSSSLFHLRLYFFIASFESLLRSIDGWNDETVNQYINILGIGQFVGVIFAPMLGPYIDKNQTAQITASFEDYRTWKIRRCAIALTITTTINLLMGIIVLIPVMQIQVVAIAAQVLLRGFFYAIHFTYFAVVFPPEHYGKLTCLSLLMGVIFGALQYPLSILTERKFGNNPFWVNVGLLLLSLLGYGQPLHLRRYLKRR